VLQTCRIGMHSFMATCHNRLLNQALVGLDLVFHKLIVWKVGCINFCVDFGCISNWFDGVLH